MKESLIHETNYSLTFLDDVARIKKREDQLRRTTHDIRTAAANLMLGFSKIYFKLQQFVNCV